jgi:hypothetical protein
MFSLKIIDTDLFLDMPMTARLLYYDLSMRADDDGFVASPKKIQRMIGCSDDDLKLLIAKQFVIPFDSGVCVIRHWRIHNYIRNDRHTETIYIKEKQQLIEENSTYELNAIPNDHQMSYQMDTQVKLGKVRLGKDDNCISDSNEYRLAAYLFGYIKKNNENVKEPNFQKWAKQFDYILRIDRRELDEVKQLVKFCQTDSFWYKNILSPEKLRKQYDRLLLDMKDNTKKSKIVSNKKENTFNNFEQRDYEKEYGSYDELEKKLLGLKD